MKKLLKSVFSPPSLRVDLIVICGVVLLLIVSLYVMFYFSRKAVQREASLYAEQTLEGTSRHIDNALLSVEQSTTNIYCELLNHLDQPERMNFNPDSLQAITQRIVTLNRSVVSCSVGTEPGMFPQYGQFISVYTVNDGDTIYTVRESDYDYLCTAGWRRPIPHPS